MGGGRAAEEGSGAWTAHHHEGPIEALVANNSAVSLEHSGGVDDRRASIFMC